MNNVEMCFQNKDVLKRGNFADISCTYDTHARMKGKVFFFSCWWVELLPSRLCRLLRKTFHSGNEYSGFRMQSLNGLKAKSWMPQGINLKVIKFIKISLNQLKKCLRCGGRKTLCCTTFSIKYLSKCSRRYSRAENHFSCLRVCCV